MARYRFGNEMRRSRYWRKEEERLCRVCQGKVETRDYVWVECDGWWTEGSWLEMMLNVLGVEGQNEGWLRELEKGG